MTGGLQEQVTDGEEWFGVGIEPAAKAVIGSQDIPYIYEDRVSQESVVNALLDMYNKRDELRDIGLLGRNHVIKNYSFEKFCKSWDMFLKSMHDKHGSWDTRRNYKTWELIEV